MGYSCRINSDKEISESEIQTIVDNIPNMLKGFIATPPVILQSDDNKFVSNEDISRWSGGVLTRANKTHQSPEYKCPFRQSWGWSLACDLKSPTGKEVIISGSYSMSGQITESFINYVVSELEKNGHKVVCEMS